MRKGAIPIQHTRRRLESFSWCIMRQWKGNQEIYRADGSIVYACDVECRKKRYDVRSPYERYHSLRLQKFARMSISGVILHFLSDSNTGSYLVNCASYSLLTMVQGIKFLTKKSFNPTNLTNQKQVWERQQQEKEAARKAKEREKQLQKERDDALLAQSRGEISKVSFLYVPPPGMVDKRNPPHQPVTNTNPSGDKGNESKLLDHKGSIGGMDSISNWAERQPGDDDATAAFRRLLAGAPSSTADSDNIHPVSLSSSGGTVLQGTTYDPMTADTARNGGSSLSALEKAVGKRPQHAQRNALSLDEQIQRFPSLANAPRVAGIGNSQGGDTSVTFKPLGAQIRNVRCLVCGTWGHSKGDRECAVSGWDPFAVATRATIAPVEPSSVDHPSYGTAALLSEEKISEEEARHLKPRKSHKRHRRGYESDRSCNSIDESSIEKQRLRKHKKERKNDKSKRRRHASSDDSSDTEDLHRSRRRKSSKKHTRR
jgi:CBF1 interacting corepressor